MENLIIQGDSYTFTPHIELNADTGVCSIIGESFVENVVVFYKPVLQWINQYCNEVKQPINFSFRLRYFNSSNSKSLSEILHILARYQQHGGSVTITWYYDSPEMLEEIEDFMLESQTQIQAIPFGITIN